MSLVLIFNNMICNIALPNNTWLNTTIAWLELLKFLF